MRSFTQLSLSLLVAVCLIGFGGCQDSGGGKVAKTDTAHDDDHDHDDHDHDDHDDDHDHDGHDHDGEDHEGHEHAGHDHGDHEHADNYDDAVAELVEMQTKIKAGFTTGEFKDDAHEPLHEVAHILENIEKLVAKSDMDDDVKKSLAKTIDELFGYYGAIDDKQHGLEGKDYDEVGEQIEASLKELQQPISKKTEQ